MTCAPHKLRTPQALHAVVCAPAAARCCTRLSGAACTHKSPLHAPSPPHARACHRRRVPLFSAPLTPGCTSYITPGDRSHENPPEARVVLLSKGLSVRPYAVPKSAPRFASPFAPFWPQRLVAYYYFSIRRPPFAVAWSSLGTGGSRPAAAAASHNKTRAPACARTRTATGCPHSSTTETTDKITTSLCSQHFAPGRRRLAAARPHPCLDSNAAPRARERAACAQAAGARAQRPHTLALLCASLHARPALALTDRIQVCWGRMRGALRPPAMCTALSAPLRYSIIHYCTLYAITTSYTPT